MKNYSFIAFILGVMLFFGSSTHAATVTFSTQTANANQERSYDIVGTDFDENITFTLSNVKYNYDNTNSNNCFYYLTAGKTATISWSCPTSTNKDIHVTSISITGRSKSDNSFFETTRIQQKDRIYLFQSSSNYKTLTVNTSSHPNLMGGDDGMGLEKNDAIRFINKDKTETLITNISIDFTVSGKLYTANMRVNSEVGYGTFVAPFDVTLPDNVVAYTASYTTPNTWIDLEEIALNNHLLPAGTPVFLSTSDGQIASQDYTATYATDADNSGILKGVYEATDDTPVGAYVLQRHNIGTEQEPIYEVGLYQVESGTQPTTGASRCYIQISDPLAAPLRLNIGTPDNVATEIEHHATHDSSASKCLIGSHLYILRSGELHPIY